MRWLQLFEDASDRKVVVQHVKAHAGTVINERVDAALLKEGAKLRFKLMEEAAEIE